MSAKPQFQPRGPGYRERPVETREAKERFLIVCEGEKMEPNYFRAFRVPREIVTVRGIGDNTIRLVQQAIELARQDEYDQIWCVFDRDSFPAEQFNAALDLAARHEIYAAYSNQAFELWFLLHFDYCQAAITRAAYCKRLTQLLGRAYQKNDRDIYEALLDRQPDAIRNAERLLQQYTPCRPERDDPSTTVHLLVQQLNRFLTP